MVTSPHHLSATMVTGREHRMTEVFGRLAPGVALETARAELQGIHAVMLKEHAEAYAARSAFRVDVVRLRDQITARARPVLLALLAASALVFLIACSNVANLILARTVRREGELAVRAALGASRGRLRRTLLAESLLLCGTGSLLGVLIAQPMVGVLARYASRFSIRALDLTLDASLLAIGVGLALAAAVFLAFVPRLPSAESAQGFALANGGLRIAGGTSRRLRLFAVTQIAASFLLLAGAGLLLVTLRSLQAAQPGIETAHVLAIDVPLVSIGRTPDQVRAFYREMVARIGSLSGVEGAALGTTVPWRDDAASTLAFSVEGHRTENGADDPRARYRSVSPGFFAVLGMPLQAGRDFTDADRGSAERVVIVSASVARQLFPGQDALNRHIQWTDGLTRFIGVSNEPRRIVGVAADLDDARIDPAPVMTIYHPFDQDPGRRLFVRTYGDPYALVPVITRAVRELYKDQPVERAATLADIRSEVLTPQRLNTIVFGGFALVALTIALVGVAGVLAFSISSRTREFGIRIAIGSPPRNILARVLAEGMVMATAGVAAGGLGGFALARWLGSYVPSVGVPGVLPVAAAALLLIAAALVASLVPAARAARVDVVRALRAD
jgi:predicted permease